MNILIFMIMTHIVDDYYLQGWLADGKQKSWWEERTNNALYKYDYIMALFCHALSWSITITLPIIIYSVLSGIYLGLFYISIPVNLIVHAVVDDLKANKHKINLIVDQSVHFLQIIITWIIFIAIF